MRNTVRALAVVSTLSLTPLTSQAAELRGLFNVGYDFGGDRLVTVIYTDGSSDFVDANRGIFFGGGVSLVWDPAGTMETQLTLNYKFEETDPFASGGVKFSTTQFDAVQVFNVSPQLSLGVGLTHHMNPKVAGTGVVSGTAQYDDATGTMFQVGFRLSDRSQIGLRYTDITYTGRGLANADGSGFGLYFNIGFGGSPARRGPAW